MSLRPDGSYGCDGCDADVENASVHVAALISDVDPDDPTLPRVLHLCREPRKGAPRGCAGRLAIYHTHARKVSPT